MANVNTIITLSSRGGNAGPFYGAYYSTDCVSYTFVNNVFLPIIGSQQTISVPSETKCIKLINLSPDCNENYVISGSASTTTTTTAAPTTTTTTITPNDCGCFGVSMTSAGEFNWLSCFDNVTYVTAVAGPGTYYQCAQKIGGLGQINIISGTGTIAQVGNCKTGACPPATTTSTTSTTSTTTTTLAQCTSYAITNTTGTTRNPSWIDCSGFPQTTNLDPSTSITICALSITNGDGCLVENNGACSTTTTTAGPTTTTSTTTTTQAPVWYYLYNCSDGSTTTSTTYPNGTFSVGQRVQYGTGPSILYFTISSVSYTDPGGIKWSVSASGGSGCPATTTTTASPTTAAPQTLQVRQCGTTSPVYYAQVPYGGYVNGLAVKLFKSGTPFNGSICWEITDANSSTTPDYYGVSVNSTWSSCSDSNCTTTTTAAPTTTTTTPPITYQYWTADVYNCTDCGAGPTETILVAFDSALSVVPNKFYNFYGGPDGYAYKIISEASPGIAYILTTPQFNTCTLACSV